MCGNCMAEGEHGPDSPYSRLCQRRDKAEKCLVAAQALKKKILKPNDSLVFDADAIRKFLDELPKQ